MILEAGRFVLVALSVAGVNGPNCNAPAHSQASPSAPIDINR